MERRIDVRRADTSTMTGTSEFVLPLVTAVLSVIPFVALGRAYIRVRSARLLLAAAAFFIFIAGGTTLMALLLLGDAFDRAAEAVEFARDILVVSLFSLSFLWPRREPLDA
jgi:hypothetical protein